MTKKADLQKELLEKVKLGTKPSDIKRLKRSRSLGDIPSAPPPPPDLEQENNRLKQELTKITQQLKALPNPPTPILTDQLKEKQKGIETLRKKVEDSAKQIEELREQKEDSAKQIETLRKQLKETTTELDKSLAARHQALKE
jgi:chromosome segregation ATPase